jgi:hypothetical protein
LFAVPELMAIRLTPQLSSVLAPLTVHGVFRQAMALTLNALRGEKDMLMRLLNVFVNEVRMTSDVCSGDVMLVVWSHAAPQRVCQLGEKYDVTWW